MKRSFPEASPEAGSNIELPHDERAKVALHGGSSLSVLLARLWQRERCVSMGSRLPKVLIVEDDDAIRGLLVASLQREPLEIDTATDGAEALLLAHDTEYAVILLDLMMPVVNGFAFVEAFRRTSAHAQTAIFVVTAFDDPLIGKFAATEVQAILRKPFDVEQLATMVREVALSWAAAHPGEEPAAAALDEPLPGAALRAEEPAD